MPPKKKKDKKKKKGKGKKEEPEQEESEYDNMDLEMLQEVVPMLKQQLAKCTLDRNYVQLERDTIQMFYDITKGEVTDVERHIAAKDREMELMEDNHRVEVRVYLQKVKHLEYEHNNNVRNIAVESEHFDTEEAEGHENRAYELKKTKKSLKLELAEREWSNAEEIKQVKQQHAKNLLKMREGFEGQLSELSDRCGGRLGRLESDLELRRKVHVHEIEERKNLHVNDLMQNHEKAFNQMKSYYNDITTDNLKLIRSLKDEVAEMKKKAVANQKQMCDISNVNIKLSKPLEEVQAEVATLKAKLSDRAKDRLSLRNCKARLHVLERSQRALHDAHASLRDDHASATEQRDALHATFEDSILRIQHKSDFHNVVLEQRLGAATASVEDAREQVREIVGAAGLDAVEMEHVSQLLQHQLAGRNRQIKDTRYEVVRMTKCYNDALRTYSQKLVELGIPAGEVQSMGFTAIPTSASTGPAGLVVQ
ncbi:growth-arrest-specific micro-tubule binding-domain-containing protein [Pelagophyceae sp. CCMP2097]|nr:growth-arrest-specific micro-tubule binding-domain-containing protein [Pelagophyceae sp. CCMP2097]|mmetsp:Transcript_19986/g.67682  ORF Transcript_19986/g.67682 Transcript_19986/m.67682 type:complete len:480 (+) Transcript_19986:214-1653(+)